MNKPNIVVILTEDLSPHAKVYGDDLSPLKSVDEIADGGLVFMNAFCTAPVCSPSRFSLITGIEPASNSPAQNHGADSIIPEGVKLLTDPLREAGYYCYNYSKADYNFVADMPQMWDDFSLSSHWRNRSDDRPFFGFYNFIETHESSIFKAEPTIVSPDQVVIPPYLPDTQDMRDDFARYYTAMNNVEARVSQVLKDLKEDGLENDTVIIQISDHGGSNPRTKRFVYDSGNKVPLIIKIPSAMGTSRIWRTPEKITTAVSLIDFAPTVLDIAGVGKPKTMVGSSLLDCAAHDVDRIVFTGRDRMDENYDLSRTARTARYLYIRNYFPNRPWLQYQSFAWQAKGYQSWETEYLAGRTNELQSKYFGEKPAEEFYDNSADPHQINNLIDSVEHQAKINEFRAALDKRTLDIFDNGFIPEGSSMEGLEKSRDSELYPLGRILELAKLAIQRDAANLPAFVELLDDENEVMRFWAAQGLLFLGEKARPGLTHVEERLQDPSAHVRITLAEIACNLGSNETGLRVYRELMNVDTEPMTLLRSLNSAINLKRPARELLEHVKELQTATGESNDVHVRNSFNACGYFIAKVSGTHEPSKLIFDDVKFKEWLSKRFAGILNIKDLK